MDKRLKGFFLCSLVVVFIGVYLIATGGKAIKNFKGTAESAFSGFDVIIMECVLLLIVVFSFWKMKKDGL